MSSTDTLAIPAADTPEGALWREILAHDDTNAAAIPAGDGGMLMGGNALSPPDLVGLVNQSDTNEGTEERTNTRCRGERVLLADPRYVQRPGGVR